MQITIGGMPGSGKSTIGKNLAKKLKSPFYSIGKIRRKLAKKRGLTILEYNLLEINTDKEVDDYQKKLGKKERNLIVEGRLAFHFLPKSIKLFFDVDLKKAAERIFKDQRDSEITYHSAKELYHDLKKRMNNDKKRYLEHYRIDAFDKKNFDYVLDTTNLTLEEVETKVLEQIKKR